MTLKDIFDEAAYGKDAVVYERNKNSILENFDRDIDVFHASGRIKNILKKCNLTEELEKIVDHICNKCDLVENRIYNEDKMSVAYKKLQAGSIYEDCEKIIAKTNKRSSYNLLENKEELGKVIGTAKYFVESYLDGNALLRESENIQFRNFVNNEEDMIREVL